LHLAAAAPSAASRAATAQAYCGTLGESGLTFRADQSTVIVMYQPDDFRVEDIPEMHALMRARPFAALVSGGAAGIYASHLPTVLKGDGPYGVIECHLARANPHWTDLAEGSEALMIFQGPEGYITPTGILLKLCTERPCRHGTLRRCTHMAVPK
jgi:hypothetical protein